jgi:hypothetical protein
MKSVYRIFCLIIFSQIIILLPAQTTKLERQIEDSLTVIANASTRVGNITVKPLLISENTKTVKVRAATNRFSHIPFRPDNVFRIYSALREILGQKYSGYEIICEANEQPIEHLIPNFYRIGDEDADRKFNVPAPSQPLTANISKPYMVSKGLQNKHLALWQSHGWYYDQTAGRWSWQRARLFQTVEDLYTQSYVLPFLVPMLENAGANVLLPRERDVQTHEVIVDEDSKHFKSRYKEHNDKMKWEKGAGAGFANRQDFYRFKENPFTMGEYRMIAAIDDPEEVSVAEWMPDIPEEGYYAVYVSYKTLLNSADDARYTVHYKGGSAEFQVNQTMGGGTWIYLGHFLFEKGVSDNKVVLTNYSKRRGRVITADAVKFGGGMGNIARNVSPEFIQEANTLNGKKKDDKKARAIVSTPLEVSGYPRFTEGARYWLQWAGVPDSVYSRNVNANDYKDDFQARGFWVNYLTGGSPLAPREGGLKIPVDLALAFHTDAGVRKNDSIVGTLAIFTVKHTNQKEIYPNGVSRWASRDLADLVQTQIVNDVRSLWAPEWERRGLWNASYSETREPQVPAMLLELLSHQNFFDMRYGLDPRFRFTVCRAIYIGMLKYLSSISDTGYVAQPLPVANFSTQFLGKNTVELKWDAVVDTLEQSAQPRQYVVYTKIDDNDFDNGVLVPQNYYTKTVDEGKIYSFKVTAMNEGGESFPSETLSVFRSGNNKSAVLIVNAFDRVSAPESFALDTTYAGFLDDVDPGIPYLYDISYTGKQYEFRQDATWISDDNPGFGGSHSNYETQVIAGNTFDYPLTHGKAIKEAGHSFVSCSVSSVLNGTVDLKHYQIVDLILGRQKQTFTANRAKPADFKTFPSGLQAAISAYCNSGGSLFVSGAHVASDLAEQETASPGDIAFLSDVLKIKLQSSNASTSGQLKVITSPFEHFKKNNFKYYDEPNKNFYFVHRSDAIMPSEGNAYTICRYAENNKSAGVAYDGDYKLCVLGFPFETITDERAKKSFMKDILSFLGSK